MIDSHCHLNFSAFKEDAPQAIERARAAGVTAIINVGSQFSTSQRAVKLGQEFDNLYAAVGLHPIHLFEQEVEEEETRFRTRAEVFEADNYRALAQSSAKVVAIGECGLDYYRFPVGVEVAAVKQAQAELFQQQIALANDLDLPIIIHCREAYDDLLGILRQQKSLKLKAGSSSRELRGVIHCYLGEAAIAHQLVDLGFYVSFTGVITFKNASPEVLESVRQVPLERLLVETDAPYLAPQAYRGQRNEPAYVVEVAKKIAELKGVSLTQVEEVTTRNAQQLFGL